MTNWEHVKILRQGADVWNRWREVNGGVQPNLRQANLSGANLCNVNLVELDLSNANFQNTDLSHTNLVWAYFRNTNFTNANLSHARVMATTFANLDLSSTMGVDTIEHGGPSSLAIDTLYRSKGQIPEVFLRGCGLPGSMIEYARSLVAEGQTQRLLDKRFIKG